MNNLKRTFLTIAFLGVVTACGSAEESSARFIESGKVFIESEDYDKARIEFRNAIQVNPTDADAYFHLALLDEKNQNWKDMYANLVTAESLDPNDTRTMIKLGQIYALTGQMDEALKRGEKAVSLESDNVDAYLLLANIYIKQENFGQAQQQIDMAMNIDRASVDVLSYQVVLYKQMGNLSEALSAANDALVIHPDAMPIHMLRLSIFDEQNNYIEMEKIYREIMPKNPNESWIVFSLAKLLNDGLNRHEDARSELVKFIESNPDDFEAKIALINLVNTQDTNESIQMLDKFISEDPENVDLRFAKNELLNDLGEMEEIRNNLTTIIEANPGNQNGIRAKTNLAQIEASESEFDKAEALVDEVLAISSEYEAALMLKAKLQLRQNQIESAISSLRVITRNNPQSDEALVLLAQAYGLQGSTQLAESSYRQALNMNPRNADAAIVLANAALGQNDYDRAETILFNAVQGNQDNETLLQQLAQVRIMKRDWAGTSKIIEDLNELDPNSAISHYLNAQMYQNLNDYTLAIAEYQNALAINPELNQALEALINLYSETNQENELVKYLNQHINNNATLTNGYLLLANYHREQQDYSKAIEVIEQGLEKIPTWVDGYAFHANLNYLQGNNEGVQESFRRGLDAFPENNIFALQLASSYENAGNYQLARQLYEEVLERDSSIDIAANNLASLLTDKFGTEQDLQKALTLASHFKNSDQPYFADTYGWINYRLGNYEEARSSLEKAAEVGSDVAVFHYHLAKLYKALAMNDEAVKHFHRARELADNESDSNLIEQINQALSL